MDLAEKKRRGGVGRNRGGNSEEGGREDAGLPALQSTAYMFLEKVLNVYKMFLVVGLIWLRLWTSGEVL
jgi:hypothetical protein